MKKKSQIFCKDVPIEGVYKLLDNVTNILSQEDISSNIIYYYKIDKIIYKKILFHDLIDNFLNSLKEFYYHNKYFYIERDMNYNNFLTIIRQICNYNGIPFKKQIIYEKDTYSIEYYLFLDK